MKINELVYLMFGEDKRSSHTSYTLGSNLTGYAERILHIIFNTRVDLFRV